MTQQPSWDDNFSPAPRQLTGHNNSNGAGQGRNIGLWGAPQSGKTTFLSAINIALERSNVDMRLFGADDASAEFLAEQTDLLHSRVFPPATEAVELLSFSLSWNDLQSVPRTVGTGTRARTVREIQEIGRRVTVEMRDAPGKVYGPGRPAERASQEARLSFDDDPAPTDVRPAASGPGAEVIDHLSGCKGMILLVDPIEEVKNGSTYKYFQATLARVARRRLAPLPDGARLPHYVAVCMTKFDHPAVYSLAKHDYRVFDKTRVQFPRVPEEKAQRFLLDFCFPSQESHIDLFCNSLGRYFYPNRVRFFVTSSIGFYLSRLSGVFHEDDYQNTVEQANGSYRIRGDIHPINVIEPLLWLSGWTGGVRA